MKELTKLKIEQLLSALNFRGQSPDFIVREACRTIILSIRLVIAKIGINNIKLYCDSIENSLLLYALCLLNSQKLRQLLGQAPLQETLTAIERKMAQEISHFFKSLKTDRSIMFECQQIVSFLLRKDSKFPKLSDREAFDIESQIVLALSWS